VVVEVLMGERKIVAFFLPLSNVIISSMLKTQLAYIRSGKYSVAPVKISQILDKDGHVAKMLQS